MKIINFEAENIKRIKAVNITPQSEVVTIAGKNGQGKSSILDAIQMAIGGGKMPEMPLRQGAKNGHIKIDLGDKIVERRFTEKGTYLYLSAPDGAQYKNPQQLLDGFVGAIAFDPLEFARAKPKDQYDALKKLVPLSVDIDELEKLNEADFDTRTDVNREVKSLEAEIAAITFADDTPDEAVDVSKLSDQLLAENDKAAKIVKAERDCDELVKKNQANDIAIEAHKKNNRRS